MLHGNNGNAHTSANEVIQSRISRYIRHHEHGFRFDTRILSRELSAVDKKHYTTSAQVGRLLGQRVDVISKGRTNWEVQRYPYGTEEKTNT